MCNSNKHQNGFTLVELMITIAILAIVAAMAVPSFNSVISAQNLKASTESLASEIKVARTKAILHKQSVTLNLASSGTATHNQFFWMPDGKVRLKTPAQNRVVFNGSGIVTSPAPTGDQPIVLELCGKSGSSDSKRITITKFGKIERISEGTCS